MEFKGFGQTKVSTFWFLVDSQLGYETWSCQVEIYIVNRQCFIVVWSVYMFIVHHEQVTYQLN